MAKKIIFRVSALLLAVAMVAGFLAGAISSLRYNKKIQQVNAYGESSARGMCTMDVETGRVFFERNADTQMGMASTTKIVTALTVLENLDDIDTKIKVDDRAIGIEGSSIYLQKGEELTVRELLYGLMLRSGNDAAVALALAVSPTVEEFAFLMNRTAQKYGAYNSNFMNPHGLDDPNHYTTARDLALLSAIALRNPIFAEISATKEKRIDGVEMPRVLYNKNRLLKSMDGCVGVKTGFTKKTGRCFVGASEIDGQKVVCVVLNCGPMFEESAQLLEDASKIFGNKVLLEKEKVFIDDSGVKAIAMQDFQYPLSESELKGIKTIIQDDILKISFNDKVIHESLCVQIDEIPA